MKKFLVILLAQTVYGESNPGEMTFAQYIESAVEEDLSRSISDGLSFVTKRPTHLPNLVFADDEAEVSPPQVYTNEKVCGDSVFAPSIGKCQVFAEEACYNPFLPDATATALQTARDSGLGSDVQLFTLTNCKHNFCDDSECTNPAMPGAKDVCIPCLETCYRYCFIHHETLCLKKVCAAALASAANAAVKEQSFAIKKLSDSPQVTGSTMSTHGNSEKASRQMMMLQTEQASSWLKSFVIPDSLGGPGFCSDEAIKSADSVVIGPGGQTYTSALVSCRSNYFAYDRIDYTSSNPTTTYLSDPSCQMIDQCPRNVQQMAKDRAAQTWNNLAEIYAGVKR